MKVLGTILLAALVAIHTIDAESHHHHRHHSNDTDDKRSHETRGLFSDACNFVCGSSQAPSGNVVPSWKVDLTGQAQIGLVIAFEGNTKSLAFINQSKETVVVFTGNKEIFGIFNVKASAGLIVNIGNGVAKYITTSNNYDLFFGANANIFSGIYALANAVYANQASVTGIFSSLLLNDSTFNFQVFINNLSQGNTNIVTIFQGKAALYNRFVTNFGALFTTVSTSTLISGGFTFSFGVLNALIGVLGNVAGVSYGFLLIVQRFSTTLDGFVNGSLLYQLFTQVSLYSEAFIARKITAVSLLADLSLSFSVSGAALFSITVNGLITVGGIIQGTVEAAASIVGRIIGSAYIGVGVSFQAGISSNLQIG